MRQWAECMSQVKAAGASFFQSDGFGDLIVDGIAPDGTFAWPDTGIVRVLREAAEGCAKGGRTQLD